MFNHPGMQNGSEGLQSIILAGQCIFWKMLRTLLIKFCILIHYKNIETDVCKTVIRLCQEFFVAKPRHHFAYLCLDNVKMYYNLLSH